MSTRITRRVELTERETETLQGLVDHGGDISKIAAAHGVSPLTTKTHLANIFSKLHVNSKVEAIVTGLCGGLISLPEGPAAQVKYTPGVIEIKGGSWIAIDQDGGMECLHCRKEKFLSGKPLGPINKTENKTENKTDD